MPLHGGAHLSVVAATTAVVISIPPHKKAVVDICNSSYGSDSIDGSSSISLASNCVSLSATSMKYK